MRGDLEFADDKHDGDPSLSRLGYCYMLALYRFVGDPLRRTSFHSWPSRIE